jgi:dTDP-4-amino-4,6-dideoxygalactose transaminase
MKKYLFQQPLLAKTSKLIYYLKKIDTNRYYSNFGPLYQECKKKVGKYLGLKKNTIIFTSSGHSSLLSICFFVKKKNPKKKFILVPSYSFQSNPQSILQSGFEPLFLDIDKSNLCMDDRQIDAAFKKYKNNIAAIMFVSPFGYPININYLNSLKKKYNTIVIYDAADTFLNFSRKTLDQSRILIACSFHPTKTLPANESGMIIAPKEYSNYFDSVVNFGFKDKNSKETVNLGLNAKFSEYDAAIFLANFNNINNIKKNIIKKIKYIVKNLNNNKYIRFQHLFSKTWISLKVLIISNNIINFNELYKKINNIYGIKIYKPWSCKPMHKHFFFKKFIKMSLNNTNYIVKRNFCIPFNLNYKKKELDRLIKFTNNIFTK